MPNLGETLRRLRPAAMPLAYLVLLLLVYWQLWTPIEGARGSWRFDPRHEYWGDLLFQARTLAGGYVALWNPFDLGGFPVYGDPQPGMLYPPNWPIYLWGALAGGVPYVAITVKILGHMLFGAIGMHLFLRRLRAPEPACYAAGLLFTFTSPKLRYGGSALNWSIAWIPWLLLATHWFAEKPSPRRAIVLGTTLAMTLLAGAPAAALYALIVALPFAVVLLWGRIRSSLLPAAIAAGVALLWILPLVASNLEMLPETVREKRDLSFVTSSAFTPGHLLNFLVPRLGGENCHVGGLALLSVGVLLAAAARRRELVFLGIAVAGIFLALGEHAGVQPALASALPPLSLFRSTHRYVYVAMAALPVLAALGLGRALTLEDEDRRRALAHRVTLVGGALTFALGVAFLVSLILSKHVHAGKNASFGLAFASALAGTLLLRAVLAGAPGRRRTWAWVAVAALALDLWTANSPIVGAGLTPPPKMPNDGLLAELPEDFERDYRFYDRGYLKYRPGTRLGVRDFGGYEGDPLALARYQRFLRASKRDLPLLGHANVAYYFDGGRRPRVKPRPGDQMKTVRPGVYRLPEVAPAVYYVPRAELAEGPGQALRALRRIEPGRGAVVEGKPPPEGPEDAAPRAGRITRLEPNRLVAEIETPGPGLVVVAEAYFPAWSAEVDGEAAPIQPANLLFRGVPISSAGAHTIEMRLAPVRFWGLLPAYAAGAGLFLWALIGPLIRRRRTRRPRSDRSRSADHPPTEGESA